MRNCYLDRGDCCKSLVLGGSMYRRVSKKGDGSGRGLSRWRLGALAGGCLIAGTMAVPVVMAVPAAATESASPSAPPCSSVYFVSARGSGQPYKGATNM